MSVVRIIGRVATLGVHAAIGCAHRAYRRLRGFPPRVWRGTFSSHLIPLQAMADRATGFPSRSVVMRVSGTYALMRAEQFDRVLELEGIANHDLIWSALFDLLRNGDIWVAFFDGLFYPIERERENRAILKLLRLVGIRIVMVNYGGDIVTWHRSRGRYDWISRLQRDDSYWNIAGTSEKTRRRIALFCSNADFVCNGDYSIARMMPRGDLVFKYFPVDLDALAPVYDAGNRVPVIAHAPQHRFVKGTDRLLEAVERLRTKGFEFELELIERVPNTEALARYARADIIADQLCIGAWGTFAQEGMALGKPVLTYLDQEHLSDPAFNVPLVNATLEQLERVLAALIDVPELRQRLGRAGRASVERYHSPAAIGEVWARIYGHVWRGSSLELETTRHFGAERVARAFTEDPADPQFWPVPVDDLMSAIRAALQRVEADRPTVPKMAATDA